LLGFPFVLLFAGALAIPVIQRSLSNRFLVFVGFTSYPLYLIHEHALVGLIQLLGLKSPVAVVLPISTLLVVAWLIARFGEPLIRRLIAVPSMIRRQRIAAMPSPN
jgi:peptidoglycan/LPS O-acetylase OafA/YrhL